MTKEQRQIRIKEPESLIEFTKVDLRKYFEQLRFDKNHHLGLGDIRLTIAQQEEICELVERFYRCRQLMHNHKPKH